MQHRRVSLEIGLKDKNYLFLCSNEAELGEIKDVLYMMLNHIEALMKNVDKSKDVGK